MKKYILILLTTSFFTINVVAQTKGVKIGYIDMEYILEKVPDYAEAKNQLEQKAQKWKQEIEEKKVDIAKQKETLKSERVLLTKELLEEREAEIAFLETELLEYQQKRFGPTGDLMTQKAVLVKPIQDQVFNIVQDISEQKKYDFVFDRSSDLTMLFAAKRHNISDLVVTRITRAEKREQMTKKQLEKEQEAERKQDMIDENPTLSDRQKILEEKRAARQKIIDDRKLAAEERKAAADEKRKQLLQAREDKKNGIVSDKAVTEPKSDKTKEDGLSKEENATDDKKVTAEETKAKVAEAKAKTLEERKKVIEDRKKAAQEKREKTIADREAAKKAKEDEKKNKEAETTKP
jgi:Skp family chaperone for outer membrane proteins